MTTRAACTRTRSGSTALPAPRWRMPSPMPRQLLADAAEQAAMITAGAKRTSDEAVAQAREEAERHLREAADAAGGCAREAQADYDGAVARGAELAAQAEAA